MRSIFAILITKFIIFGAYAEEPSYSTRILHTAEYDRLEKGLADLSSEIRTRRENIKKATESFNESRKLLDLIFVYALERLHRDNKRSQFSRLTQILDNAQLRDQIYYPVRIGFFDKDDYWIKFSETECVNLYPQDEIETGLFVQSATPLFENLRLGKRTLTLTDSFISRNGEHIRYTLAQYKFDKSSSISALIESFTQATRAMIKHYNCDYVERNRQLEKDYAKAMSRYHYLAEVLDRPPKDFAVEKKTETITEIFDELIPADEPTAADIDVPDEEPQSD